MSKNKKYYVVWRGRETGVFSHWNSCKKQINGFEGAQYKSFANKEDAEMAITKSYQHYIGKDTSKKKITLEEREKYGAPISQTISVDAACSGNPGKMEYRGVFTDSKKQIFIQGPFNNGTNNIGEFLALVHCLALLKQKKMQETPIYSDSKIAMSWIRQKKCKTNLTFKKSDEELKQLIIRAEKWLEENPIKNPVLKWHTKVWGEIPADFGRK